LQPAAETTRVEREGQGQKTKTEVVKTGEQSRIFNYHSNYALRELKQRANSRDHGRARRSNRREKRREKRKK
jgi:hypothetical protein